MMEICDKNCLECKYDDCINDKLDAEDYIDLVAPYKLTEKQKHIKEYKKQYYQKNKEKIKAYQQANKEKINAKRRERYEKDREKA